MNLDGLIYFLLEAVSGWIDAIQDAWQVFLDEVKASLKEWRRAFFANPGQVLSITALLCLNLVNAFITFLGAIGNGLLQALLLAGLIIAELQMPKGFKSSVMTCDDALRLVLRSIVDAANGVQANPFGPWGAILLSVRFGKMFGKLRLLMTGALRAIGVGLIFDAVIKAVGFMVRIMATFFGLTMLAFIATSMNSNTEDWKSLCLNQKAKRKKWYAHRGLEETALNSKHRIIRRRDPGGSPP